MLRGPRPVTNPLRTQLSRTASSTMPQKNILLIEPGYPNKYPPLGLMKIAAYHGPYGRDDNVLFVKGDTPEALERVWDRIYVTTLFSFEWKANVGGNRFRAPCRPWTGRTCLRRRHRRHSDVRLSSSANRAGQASASSKDCLTNRQRFLCNSPPRTATSASTTSLAHPSKSWSPTTVS